MTETVRLRLEKPLLFLYHSKPYLSYLADMFLYTQVLLPHIFGRESKTCIFDFYIFQERQNTNLLLLGVSYIAENQTGLYLVTSKFTVIGVLNFQ